MELIGRRVDASPGVGHKLIGRCVDVSAETVARMDARAGGYREVFTPFSTPAFAPPTAPQTESDRVSS